MGNGYDFLKDTTNFIKVNGFWKYKPIKSYKQNHSYGGTSAYPGGSYTFTAKTCKVEHLPSRGIKIGDFEVYPTKGSLISGNVLNSFDVACPLTDTGYGDHYTDFCGLLMWFPIKDMTAPDPMRLRVNAQRLVKFVQQGAKVTFWCIGSHGRTGTLLATMIGLLEPDVDPVAECRSRHCEHAIETQSQLESIFKALKRPLPAKYKPTTTVKTYPKYITDGKLYGGNVQENDILDSYENNCDLCEKEGGTGKDKLHWKGKYRVHDHCWEEAYNKHMAEEAAKANTASSVPSSSTPTPDSPSGAVDLRTDAQKFLAETQTQDLNEEDRGWSSDFEESFRAEILKERPFNKKRWTKSDRRKTSGVQNDTDFFGDYICPACEYLVVDAKEFAFTYVKGKTYVEHKDCVAAINDPDTVPLCGACWDKPAEADGYCSLECQQHVLSKKEISSLTGNQNGATPTETQTENTSPLNLVQ